MIYKTTCFALELIISVCDTNKTPLSYHHFQLYHETSWDDKLIIPWGKNNNTNNNHANQQEPTDGTQTYGLFYAERARFTILTYSKQKTK